MNHDEAKFILRAYRPGGQDTDDPRFAEVVEYIGTVSAHHGLDPRCRIEGDEALIWPG